MLKREEMLWQEEKIQTLGLFTLVADILSRLLAREEATDRISGVKVWRASPKIFHLLYADDLVIYCKAVHCEAAMVGEGSPHSVGCASSS